MEMKAVVVDGYMLNPGDLNWDRLKGLAECEIYECSEPGETIERCKDADIVIILIGQKQRKRQ